MNKIFLQTILAIGLVFSTVNISYANGNACPCVAECKKKYDKCSRQGYLPEDSCKYSLGTCVLRKCYNDTSKKKQ